MRINHNMMAMNAHRALVTNTDKQTKSLEKLSSGLAINRAADNAAGLSISEKMRGQIAGLTQAASNAQDGVSFLQTAEGAMNEVSSMLTRMEELTTQRANGTYAGDDTNNINLELAQLKDEIGNIISTTNFNGKSIDGNINVCLNDDTTSLTTIGIADASTAVSGNALQGYATGEVAKTNAASAINIDGKCVVVASGETADTLNAKLTAAGFKDITARVDGTSISLHSNSSHAIGTATAAQSAAYEDTTVLTASTSKTITINGKDITFKGITAADWNKALTDAGISGITASNAGDDKVTLTPDSGVNFTVSNTASTLSKEYNSETVPADAAGKITTVLFNDAKSIDIKYTDTAATIATALTNAGISGISVTQNSDNTLVFSSSSRFSYATTIKADPTVIQPSTPEIKSGTISGGLAISRLLNSQATEIDTSKVKAAIKEINTVRATFGAQQNRLESVVNNLSTTTENLQAAESRIRDTDMASEMANFNKYNILLQASTSMLSQANSAPQTLLSLFR